MTIPRINKYHIFWILLGLGTLLLRVTLGRNPELVEAYYSRGLFLWVRRIIDSSVSHLPVPLLYLLVLILAFFLGRNIFRFFRNKEALLPRILRAIYSLLAFAGGLLFFFFFLWGFNYGRVPIEQQIGIYPEALSLEELKTELQIETFNIKSLRKVVAKDANPAYKPMLGTHLKRDIRNLVEHTLQDLNYPSVGHVQMRVLQPKGLLLRISTSGFYFPFIGEGHIDAGLHPLQYPSVMAHEFAHGYGITDEGSCNFIAFLACQNSSDPLIRYSGHLGYWRYLASSYRRQVPEEYATFRETLPEEILADLQAIRTNNDQYPDIFPEIRDYAYGTYLQAQGIKEGLKNYSRVILLVKAWREKYNSLSSLRQ